MIENHYASVMDPDSRRQSKFSQGSKGVIREMQRPLKKNMMISKVASNLSIQE